MRIFLSVLALLFSEVAFAQLTATATPPVICSNGSSDLSVSANALTAPVQVSSPTLPMGDDTYSAAVPIGFSFDFYGNTFTDCLISSNGYITFDLTNAGMYSSWVTAAIPGGVPGGTGPAVNAIFGPWIDLQPAAFAVNPGTIEYQTIGTAPDRIFIVKWYEVPLYGSSCGQCSALTIKLFETTNRIENHISDMDIANCTWNTGSGTHGIQNGNGTIAHVITDPITAIPRNNTSFAPVGPEGWEYIPDPNNPNNYTINQIPFSLTSGSANIVWTETLSGVTVGTGATITVSPTVTTEYTVTISENCPGLNPPSTANVTVSVSDLTLTPNSVDVDCNGNASGSITITPVGTASPWDFDWQDSNGNSIQTDLNVNGPISLANLSGDSYTVNVTDDLGCVATEIIVVNEPTALSSTLIGSDISCFGSNDGAINTTANGGTTSTGNYSFSWIGPNGFNSNNPDIMNLEPGFYTVTITDDNGCPQVDSYNVLEPTELIAVMDSYVDVTCFGFTDGAINATVSGGTPFYTLSWTGPNGYSNNVDDINNLEQGLYNLSVLDANNCPASLIVTVGQADVLTNTFVKSNYNNYNVSCNGYEDGIIDATTNGGAGPYVYNWTGPNGFTSSNEDIINLVAGTYNLIVTDAQNCSNSETVTINEPNELQAILQNHADVSCHYESDGFIETSCFGSVSINGNYYYNWSGPNFFVSNEPDIYNLSEPGIYTLIATDDNDCMDTVSYDLFRPEELKAIIYNLNDTITDNYPIVNFHDRSIGNPVAWIWSISDGTTDTYAQDKLDHHFLYKGDYIVNLKVENSFGCVDSTSKIIRVIEEHTLYVPNAFTPDLDGRNDIFKVQHHALREDTYQIAIYDRFGSLVYTSQDPNSEWDGTNDFSGKKLTSGAYTYYISYQDWDGWKYDHTNCENCTGTVTLIR